MRFTFHRRNLVHDTTNRIIPMTELSRLVRTQLSLRAKKLGMEIGSRVLAQMLGNSLSVRLKKREHMPKK